MEGGEETLGSSKVSLAAVHKKTKKPCLKQDGRHTQQLRLSFDLHTHVAHASTGWWTESQVAENWGFFSTWLTNSMCRKGHRIHYLGEAGHESCSFWEDASFLLTSLLSFLLSIFMSLVQSFVLVYTWAWKSKQVCLGCTYKNKEALCMPGKCFEADPFPV